MSANGWIRPLNIIISGTNFWNPGDDFVRDGIIRVLRESFPDAPLNFLFYNFNPDFFPNVGLFGKSNFLSNGDLEKFRGSVDAVVICGVSAGHELKDLYRWILANRLERKVFLISGHYESGYCAEHISQEPEASIFRNARLAIGRTNRKPDFIQSAGIHYLRLNCPAILSVPEVKTIVPGQRIRRIGFSIQLPPSCGGLINQSCSEQMYALALEVLRDLSRTYNVEVVAHHKTEYFHFLNLLHEERIPVIFSSFYQHLSQTYRHYDLVITTRLHASLLANGHGIPGIIINNTERHIHALEGFPHSPCVSNRDDFEKAFARWTEADLSLIAKESADFKSKLLMQYVQVIRPLIVKNDSTPDKNSRSSDNVRRILFVRTDSIGDAVLASSMIEPIRKKFSNAKLAILCQQHVADLYLACPFIDSIICFDRMKIEEPAVRDEIVAEIAAFNPDLILNSTRSRDHFSNEMTQAFRNARHVAIESDLNNISELDHARSLDGYETVIPSPEKRKLELDRHADFLRGLGIQANQLQSVIWTSPDDELLADAFFKQHGLEREKTIALFPGAQHDVRVYRGYADALTSFDGFRFLIFGDGSQTNLAAEIESQLGGRALNLCGRSSLRETAALVRRCRLYVGAESAGAHMACAVGVPNVVLLGGGHFGRFMPYSPLTSAVALPLECFDCNWRCPYNRAHCVKDVQPEVLAEAIHQTLKERSPHPRVFVQSSALWNPGGDLPKWKNPAALLNGLNAEIIEVKPANQKLSEHGLNSPASTHERVGCPICECESATPVRRQADIVRCDKCETVFLRTRLTSAEMRKLYQSYADEGSHMALPKSSSEAEQSGLARDYFLKEILQFIEPSGELLDVGCGWGGFLLNARRKGFVPRGIELTSKCLTYANEELGIPVLDTQLEETEIAPGSLSVVTMNHVFEHLPQPILALKKIIASLKPGGMFCGIVPNFASACSDALKENWYWLDPNYHYTHFTPATLRRALESAGFVVEKIYTATGDYGRDAVRRACRAINPELADHDYFDAELKRYEADGRGEEIRFFARKPAVADPAILSDPSAECELIPKKMTGPDPVVTVVVSTYQSEKFIRACLENLSRQKNFARCEIIVVDSGSPENERAIVTEFKKKFPNIRYVRTPRETLYAAWNRGLALARGRYWANVNTDDTLRGDALEILSAALDAFPDCALAYADCAWTTKPNDTFPSEHIVRTVKYPDYTPIEPLFYCITGCLQFWRTDSIRKLGGFESSLRNAGDYEATLKMMAARLNAVHVPEVLSLFYQNTSGLTQATNRAAVEHDEVMNRYRANLDIQNIFQIESGHSAAEGFIALGYWATRFSVPWEDKPFEHLDFAFSCYYKALELDPPNFAAGMNLIALNHKLNRLDPEEPELIRRWPKMREWIARFRSGEKVPVPKLKPALTGPVFRSKQRFNGAPESQIALEPKAIRPWVSRRDGRFTYLSEKLIPAPREKKYSPKELETIGIQIFKALAEFPPFHAHFGGAGDALLLLASYYDQQPGQIVLSYPNSVGATRAFFEAFPVMGQVYFLPLSDDPRIHVILRWIVHSLPNCLGAGATPKEGYDEWKAGLDLTKTYKINKSPRWATAFRSKKNSRQITLAPQGSLHGMVGSKRNIIDPAIWPKLLRFILENGFTPCIIGTPEEKDIYPCIEGCEDRRSYSFREQMEHIGNSEMLIAADSWAKTFSALAGIPTIVFDSLKGPDWNGKKDASDFIFLDPWESITVVKNFEQCREVFARLKKPDAAQTGNRGKTTVSWHGSFLDHGSLSHVNRHLTGALETISDLQIQCVTNGANASPDFKNLAAKISSATSLDSSIAVRHAWPPDWSRPANGKLVVIQPWEFGSLPTQWVEQAKRVDEFWVPSNYVRNVYVNSGVDSKKVFVVPNGVDPEKFHPQATPMKLATSKNFKFLFVGGTIFRKGPDLLLKAYLENFTASDDVCLVIKDFGGQTVYAGQTIEAHIRAAQSNPNAPEILYLNEEFPPDSLPGLFTACNCFVLPYRGEGFGLPALEAMACGLPIIVTAGGATDDFVRDEFAFRISAKRMIFGNEISGMKLVKPGWLLEPDVAELGRKMRAAFCNPSESTERGRRGSEFARQNFSWKKSAEIAATRIRAIATQPPADRSRRREEVDNIPIHKNPPSHVGGYTSAKPIELPTCAKLGHLADARELLKRKQHRAAWENTIAAINVRPFHPEAFLLLAEIALAAGDSVSARRFAQHAHDLVPNWKPAKKFLKGNLRGNAKHDWLVLPEPIANQKSEIKNRLSVCLITKNEERFVAQCLKSIRDIAHQIVVVDTGSTDRTVELAKENGAQVFHFTWNDDFSAARNAALERVTGDWVLVLDADEELLPEHRATISKEMQAASIMAYRLPIIDKGKENEGCSYVPRLFRNAPGLFFVGRVHEQVFSSIEVRCEEWGLKNQFGKAALLHHGYTQEIVVSRDKVARNLRLLERAVEELPGEPNLLMSLGLELVRSKQLEAGLERYWEALRVLEKKPAKQVVPEFRETLLTQLSTHLMAAKRFDEIEQLWQRPFAKSNMTASQHFLLGLAQMELKRPNEAAEQMRLCVSKRHLPALSPIHPEILRAGPNHCLALSLAVLKRNDEAEKAFRAALADDPQSRSVKFDFARFFVEQSNPLEALKFLHALVAENSGDLQAWQFGGQIALSQIDFLEFARDWTGEAIKQFPEDVVLVAQRAEALLLSGDVESALPFWRKLPSTAKNLSALTLCEFLSGKEPQRFSVADENVISREFLLWYRKLIAANASEIVCALNERMDSLRTTLPTFVQIWSTAARHAEEVCN